ncbi:putative tensin phosphatase, C2 domain, protein-tyrosine phosphatase, C2 domain superfamily [Helianthus debilis subsp. tardiflorus]
MALFKCLDCMLPPHGLIEISEKVYFFDFSVSTKVLNTVADLQARYSGLSFMVFNFKEGDTRTQISDILSQYDMMTVTEYPLPYEGCPILPLEVIHHVLRRSESWLSVEGQQNALLLHCERGGWPVLAFMLAALVLFRKQYSGEQKTLEIFYKFVPTELLRNLTPFNPKPSQLRYLQYVSERNLGSDWPSSDASLDLDCIILRFLPLFGEKGCRPVIRIYGQDSSSSTANMGSTLLFTSEEQAHYYQPDECKLVKIDIHHRVQGDVVLECIHLDDVREEMIFRVMFNTTFVRNNVLKLGLDEVDVMWDARDQMPKNFEAEVCFENKNGTESPAHEEFFDVEEIFNDTVDA